MQLSCEAQIYLGDISLNSNEKKYLGKCVVSVHLVVKKSKTLHCIEKYMLAHNM